MRKWMLDLEIVENEDEFFKTLNYAEQHKALKGFILEILGANGFDTSRIRLSRYEEDYGNDEDFQEYEKPTSKK